MVKSIEFPDSGKGYIFAKIEEPCPPIKSTYESYEHEHGRGRGKKISATKNPVYNELMKKYREEMKYWRKHKDDYISPDCARNLIGHKFEFQDSKINVIFGPNGSGKTTIIRAIAANAMCRDGFTSFREPIDFGWGLDTVEYDPSRIIEKEKKNSCTVEWDGTPVYFDNFEQTRRTAYGTLGGFSGSIVGDDLGSELIYRINSDRISAGQHSMFIMNRIIEIASVPVSMEEITAKANNSYVKGNDVWQKCGQEQVEYFKKYPRFHEKIYPTLMFDEVDKSLDIETVWKLYTHVFPKIVEKWKNQIILVSHNPLILSDAIYNNHNYNIISIDPEYTSDVKNILKGVSF